jgi:hypothetical protein
MKKTSTKWTDIKNNKLLIKLTPGYGEQ